MHTCKHTNRHTVRAAPSPLSQGSRRCLVPSLRPSAASLKQMPGSEGLAMESAANGVGTSTVVEAPVRKARADCEGLKRHPTRSLACESESNLTTAKKKTLRCQQKKRLAAMSALVLGGWGFLCCLESPNRSRGRLPVGLGSSNKIPVPYSTNQRSLSLTLIQPHALGPGLCLSFHWMLPFHFCSFALSACPCRSDGVSEVTSLFPFIRS